MLPGKKYQPEDYLRILWARKWFAVLPTVVISAAVFAYSMWLPNRYRSTASVLVVGQQVPEALVRPTITDSVADRLRAIQSQILSRTRLERIIDEFNLYRRERETMIMEDIVERMRTRDLNISINAPRRSEANSFDLSFTAENPRTAMAVADRLASLFVQENLLNRGTQAETTTQFFQAQLEEARRKLKEYDERLAAFRQQNAGRLPAQTNSNLQMLQTVQTQIQANTDAGNKERDRLTILETKLGELTAAAAASAGPGPGGGPAPAAQQLAAARAALRGLQLSKTEDHPDIRNAKRVIAELEVKAEEEALNAPLSQEPVALASSRNRGETQAIASVRTEIAELRASLERRETDDKRLRERLASYAVRLEAAPGVESELSDLMRDYETMREAYESLLTKSDAAKLAESLERRQIGEQFKVIDNARLPERPVSPDRARMNIMGLLAGLGFGLGLVALLEYRDTTLKTDSDVLMSLSLPVLAVIPAMTNDVERRRRRQRRRLAAVAASLMVGVVGAAAIAWRLRLLDGWIR